MKVLHVLILAVLAGMRVAWELVKMGRPH